MADPSGLWIGPHATEQISAWWVWDIAIDADQRGKGFGREAMLLAEDRVREHGGPTLGLNVGKLSGRQQPTTASDSTGSRKAGAAPRGCP
jgi:GNAT superfamily N-acetyltransferase